MRRTKEGLRFLPLSEYKKAKRDAQSYRSLYREELIGRALAEAKERIAKADEDFTNSLLEWLTLYPLQAKSMEELEKWKEDYRAFRREQYAKYEEKKKNLREVRLSVGGVNRTYKVMA